MKFELAPKKKGDLELGLIYGSIVLLGFVMVRFLRPLIDLFPPCMFHSLTGLPCPSCGATRCAVLLARGDVFGSFEMNPLFFLLYIGLASWGIISVGLLVTKKKLIVVSGTRERKFMRWGAVMLLLVNWFYLVVAELRLS